MKAVFFIALVIGSAISAPLQTSPSICDPYATALGLTGKQVVDAIVTQTITNIVGSGLKRFFDGSIAGTTDFVNNQTALTILQNHLTSFFGASGVLNCTDGSVVPSGGNNNMQQVHQKLPIALGDSILFNNLLLQAAVKVGVNAVDGEKVRAILNSVRYDICNTGTTCNPGSFCDKYSIALNLTNNELVSTVVDGTIAKVTTDALKRFFDGSIKGTVNFLDPNNAALLATLRLHLIQFFAQAGVLDCTDNSVGAYTGKTMLAAHAALPIATADFNLFNQDLLAVLKGAGVVQADLDAALKILESTKGDICNQPDCKNSASGLFFSAFLLFAAFLVTLF